MSDLSLIIVLVILVYFTYDNILLLYKYNKEELSVGTLSYIKLARHVPIIMICSMAGIILTLIGIFQDSHIVAALALVTMISANIGFKRELIKEINRDYDQEEIDYYDKILNDPNEGQDKKEAVRTMKETTLKIQREERKNQMKRRE